MSKAKVFYFLIITIFFLHSKVYSQEIEFIPHTIVGGEFAAFGARSVYAADVDGDGDMDVLSASSLDDKIAWYENNGNENFSAHTIATGAFGANSVYAADVDGDGDMDVLSSSSYDYDDKIAWYENDGDENFSTHIITNSASGAWSVYAVDVDGDGDIDVLSASYWDEKIAWYENDGDENFSSHIITINANGARSVYSVDVDGDGDMDVLSASSEDDKIAWYENDGDENFSTRIITTSANWATSVYATDVDGDGDMDVLSASYLDNKIAWYENLQISGINGDNLLILKSSNLINFPNPFHPAGSGRNPFTTIEFNLHNNSKVNLSIYNIKGQLVQTLVDKNLSKGRKNYIWNGINNHGIPVPSGIYLYKLEVDGKFVETKKMSLIK